MPAKSRAQQKLMCGVAKGNIKKEGISKSVAKEYCTKVSKTATKRSK